MNNEDLMLQKMIDNYQREVLKKKQANICRASSAAKCISMAERRKNNLPTSSHSQPCLFSMVESKSSNNSHIPFTQGSSYDDRKVIQSRSESTTFIQNQKMQQSSLNVPQQHPSILQNTSSIQDIQHPPSYQFTGRENTLRNEFFNIQNENKQLKIINNQLKEKCIKLDGLSMAYDKIEKEFDRLLMKREKSERVHEATIEKLEKQIEILVNENNNLQKIIDDKSSKNEYSHEVKQMKIFINELIEVKERQNMEIEAQNGTLQEQRNHIDMLEKALFNAQERFNLKERQLSEMNMVNKSLQKKLEEVMIKENEMAKEIKKLKRGTEEISEIQKLRRLIFVKEENICNLKKKLKEAEKSCGIQDETDDDGEYEDEDFDETYIPSRSASYNQKRYTNNNSRIDNIEDTYKERPTLKQQYIDEKNKLDQRLRCTNNKLERQHIMEHYNNGYLYDDCKNKMKKKGNIQNMYAMKHSHLLPTLSSGYSSQNHSRSLSSGNEFPQIIIPPNPIEAYRDNLLRSIGSNNNVNLDSDYTQTNLKKMYHSHQQMPLRHMNNNYNSDNLTAEEYLESKRNEISYNDDRSSFDNILLIDTNSNNIQNSNQFTYDNNINSHINIFTSPITSDTIHKNNVGRHQLSFKSSSSSSSTSNSKTNSVVISEPQTPISNNNSMNKNLSSSNNKHALLGEQNKSNSINSMAHSKSSSEAETTDEIHLDKRCIPNYNNDIEMQNNHYIHVQTSHNTLVPKTIIVNDDEN
uniref:Leucine-rich repeat-containing protein DDB_G0290503 n=1 Tax=Parastrongyloides trichosuri TaxID=131310 RepID=A0A0N4ZQ40_PARTI